MPPVGVESDRYALTRGAKCPFEAEAQSRAASGLFCTAFLYRRHRPGTTARDRSVPRRIHQQGNRLQGVTDDQVAPSSRPLATSRRPTL